MNFALRLAVGVVTIGSTVGGGYALYKQLSTENIEKKLLANGYQILEEGSNEWREILKNYKETVITNENLKFSNFNGDSEKTLKEECSKAIKLLSNDNKSYKKAKQWCILPKKLSEVLTKEEYTALNTAEDDSLEKDDWDKKLDEHFKETKANKKFDNSSLVTAGKVTKVKTERDAIKGECKKLMNKKHYETSFESDLEKAKLWCANKKN